MQSDIPISCIFPGLSKNCIRNVAKKSGRMKNRLIEKKASGQKIAGGFLLKNVFT